MITIEASHKGEFVKKKKKVLNTYLPVQFSCSVMSDSLWPQDCSMPGFPVHHNLPEFTQTHVHWCHPTISSSVITFSSCLQSFTASGSFQMSQFFASGGQSIGDSASASVLLMNIQDWFSFRMDWFDILVVQGTLKSLLQHHSSKASVLWCSAFFIVHVC